MFCPRLVKAIPEGAPFKLTLTYFALGSGSLIPIETLIGLLVIPVTLDGALIVGPIKDKSEDIFTLMSPEPTDAVLVSAAFTLNA